MFSYLLPLLVVTLSPSKVWSQQFSNVALPPSWPGISTSCYNALNTTMTSCPGFLAQFALNNRRLNSTQLTELCTSSCKTELANVRNTIISGCKNTTSDVIKYYDGVTYPPTFVIDRFTFTYNIACRQDLSTGIYCDNIFASWLGITNLTTAQTCSDCALGVAQLQLNSPFGYDPVFASAFSSTTSSCGKTGYAYTSPSNYALSTTTTTTSAATSTTTAVCAKIVTVGGYDTCNSIALANNVSTYSVIYAGNLVPDCSNLVIRSSLCLPGPCMLYQVQPLDNCTSILAQFNASTPLTATQLLAWNPNINSLCGNIANYIGTYICVSPPGGYLTNVTPTGSLAASTATTAAAKPTNAPAQSNSNCGLWYTVQSGDYCQKVAQANAITLNDFYFLNPEINANCTNLLLGLAYCVQAVGDITTYSGYPKTTPFITLTSTTYTTAPTTTYPSSFGFTATPYGTLSPKAPGARTDCAYYRNYQTPLPVVDQSSNLYISSYLTGQVNSCAYLAGLYYTDVPTILSNNPTLNATNCTLLPGYSYCMLLSRYISNEPSVSYGCYQVTNPPSGTISTCSCFTQINGYDNGTYGCSSIATNYNITVNNILTWNTWIGSNCETGLYANLSSTAVRPLCVNVYPS